MEIDLPSNLLFGRWCASELCVVPRVVTTRRAHSGRAPGTMGHQKPGAGPRPCRHCEPWATKSPCEQLHFSISISFQIEFQFKFVLGLNLFKFCSHLNFGTVIPSFEFK
jgi:hypothetical protein